MCHPMVCLFSMGILLSCRHRRNFENSRSYSFVREMYITRELLPEVTFSSEKPMCMEGKHVYAYTKHLLFLSSYELTSSSLKPRPPLFFFAQGCMYRSLKRLAAFWISDFCRGPAWNQTCFTLGNLSYVNLIMRPVKEPRREQGAIKLLLHIQLYFFLLFLSYPNPSPTTCLTSPKKAFWNCFKPQGCLTLSSASRA